MTASPERLVALAAVLAQAADKPGMPRLWHLAEGVAIALSLLNGPARLTIAAGALMALDAEPAEELAEAVLADVRRGAPVPPFGELAAEARDWAAFASPAEREAYAAAALYRLPPARRRAILAAIERRERARRTRRAA